MTPAPSNKTRTAPIASQRVVRRRYLQRRHYHSRRAEPPDGGLRPRLGRLQRAEDLRLLDTTTGKTLNTQTLTSFVNGVYLVWRVRGQITLQVTNHSGPIDAVVSGIFFSPV